jgi:N-acetylglucosaminyldiphosphoundecaprenol N-acetyl-beta-D-mannosaminyltransferase
VSSRPIRRLASVRIFGVRVDDVVEDEVFAWIDDIIRRREVRRIATVNPEFLMEARDDPTFAAVLNAADIATADGAGVLWAAQRFGRRLRGRVTGSDLALRIIREASARSWRLFLLGAAPGVAERVAAMAVSRAPGVAIVGCHAGDPAPEYDDVLVARVRAARPDILLVAYPFRAQEHWIARNLTRLQVPVTIGVGGAFDFIAGVVPRAPAWMRRLGLEWAYRVLRQPWRWRRIVRAVPAFIIAVLRAGAGPA